MNTKYLTSINFYFIMLLASFLVCTGVQAGDNHTEDIDIEEAIEEDNLSLVKDALTNNEIIIENDRNEILGYITKPEMKEKYKNNELIDILDLLLKRYPDLLSKKEKAVTLLRKICSSNNEDLMRKLLNLKKDYSNETLVNTAFICANDDTHNSIKVLLESPLLKFPLRNKYNTSILAEASNSKSVNVVKVLLESKKNIEINYQHEKPQGSTEIKSSKRTALVEASSVDNDKDLTKSLDIVKLLLENNANPNLLDASHQGAFTKAIANNPRSRIARAILIHDQFDWNVKYDNNTILHKVIQNLEAKKEQKESYINSKDKSYKKLIPSVSLNIKELQELLEIILEKNIVDPQAINKDDKKAIDLTQDEKIKKQLKEAEEKYKKTHPNQGGKPKFNIFQSKGAKIAVVMVLITLSLGAIGGVAFLIMKKKSNNQFN